MKYKHIKMILAVTIVLAAISASVIATFAAEAVDYVYAKNFDGMTEIAQGQNGMSKNQAPPSLARIAKDPAEKDIFS